ncbi:MAG: AAA family ATPase [bacterium]
MKDITQVNNYIKKEIIIDEIMISKGLYCLVSNAKVGKSMFALQMSNAIALGKQFLGFNTIKAPVLYISTESNQFQIKDRCKLLGIEFSNNSFFVIDRNEKGQINLSDIELELQEFSLNYNGKLVIIDMLKDLNIGIDYQINDYQDVGQILLPKFRELCDKYNFTILFTHHLNKKGKVLGSTAFDAVVDGKITLIENSKDKSLVRLKTINRNFKELDIQLKKSDNQVFNVVETIEEDDIDYNLIQLIKFISNNNDYEFTCSQMVYKLNLQITPRSFGRLINSNIELLKKEGLIIENVRNGNARLYKAHYDEIL